MEEIQSNLPSCAAGLGVALEEGLTWRKDSSVLIYQFMLEFSEQLRSTRHEGLLCPVGLAALQTVHGCRQHVETL